jgi:hypothetical protein
MGLRMKAYNMLMNSCKGFSHQAHKYIVDFLLSDKGVEFYKNMKKRINPKSKSIKQILQEMGF